MFMWAFALHPNWCLCPIPSPPPSHRGWRHFIAWMGAVPATRANLKRLLRKGSVAVIVGGIAEVCMKHTGVGQGSASPPCMSPLTLFSLCPTVRIPSTHPPLPLLPSSPPLLTSVPPYLLHPPMQMFMCNRSQENVVLRARKGFVRAAVEEGLDGGIVPVFHFGNSQVHVCVCVRGALGIALRPCSTRNTQAAAPRHTRCH